MLIALLAAVVGQVSANDFFPLDPGIKWTYEITGDTTGSYSQEVGFPVDFNDRKIAPIYIKSGSKIVQTTFYDVQASSVAVLGHDAKKLFDKPMPVFQVSEKETRWVFDGPSPYDGDSAASMTMKGSSKIVGMRDVLGEKRLCIEVKTETRIGITEATATRFIQTSLYAKGVGLAQMDEIKTFGKRTYKSKYQVVSMQRPEVGR